MTAYPTPPGTPNPLNYYQPRRNDLREIAVRQRAIMLCILGYIVLFTVQFMLPGPLRLLVGILACCVSLTAMVFVFLLAFALYNTAAGMILGLLTLIPVVGLIVLLIVNGKATATLRAHDIKVGLLGADMSQIPNTTTG